MFSLIINTDNAAFEGAEAAETARILREVAARLERGQLDGIARDLNGNKAGEFRLNAATALAEHLDGPADDTVLAMTPRPESDSPENIGAGCSNAYLSELVDSASEDASEGRPLNALQVAALDEAASRIRERIGDDEPGDYHGPAA